MGALYSVVHRVGEAQYPFLGVLRHSGTQLGSMKGQHGLVSGSMTTQVSLQFVLYLSPTSRKQNCM